MVTKIYWGKEKKSDNQDCTIDEVEAQKKNLPNIEILNWER